jgi:hypothetical protein
MSRVLDMMWTSIVTTWNLVRDWLTGLAGDPALGLALTIALLIAVVAILFLLLAPFGRPRERTPESRPELLVSRGEVRSFDESSLTELSMHVSNLGDGVAQLLEVALSSDLMPTPETVELTVLVPRSQSVDVRVPVEELHGDTGFLDLYFYTPQKRRRAYRLRASLAWEPWNGRYKIEPLGQRIEPARRLASSRLQRRQREEWRRRQREAFEDEPHEPLTEPDQEPGQDPGTDDQDDQNVTARERLEFPSDF